MSHAVTNEDWLAEDPELRESLRVIRHQRSMRLVGVAIALIAAIGAAAAYAALSYSDRNESPPAQGL